MKSDRLVTELETIREGLYREQPMTMDAVEHIINLLQYVFCPHEWEHKTQPGTADGPDEHFTVCKKCGADKMEE